METITEFFMTNFISDIFANLKLIAIGITQSQNKCECMKHEC